MASKAKYMPQRYTILGGEGVVKRWSHPKEELSSLKHHSLILRPILHKSAIFIVRQQ